MDAALACREDGELTPGELHHQAAMHIQQPRWIAPAFLLFSVALVPWTVWLALNLPHRYVSNNYHLAWVGFDVALTVVLLTVMWLAWRRSTYVEPVSAAAGAMLLVDAWFDVTSARPGRDLALAIMSAVLIELPIAALCWWTARNAEELRRRQDAWSMARLFRSGGACQSTSEVLTGAHRFNVAGATSSGGRWSTPLRPDA